MLIGTLEYALDSKARIYIPARFRLPGMGNDSFIVVKSFDPCLIAYPRDRWDSAYAQLTRVNLSFAHSDARSLARYFLGSAAEVMLDAHGRALLPRELREFARLDRRVRLVGMATSFEIWDPHALDVNVAERGAMRAGALARLGFLGETVTLDKVLESLGLPTQPVATEAVRGRLFICYSSSDRAFVDRLTQDLEQLRVRLWVDQRELLPGESLTESLSRAIETSTWFLVVLSPRSVASRWCREELGQALARERNLNTHFVLPVVCEKCEIPGPLLDKVHVNMSTDALYRRGLEALLRRLTAS